MPSRGYTMSLSFPPFTHWVKRLILANAAIFFAVTVLNAFSPDTANQVIVIGGLKPVLVAHGFLWQLVTYSFLHAGLWHLFSNMLGLWMFGSQLESDWGGRQFLEFYFFCVVAAALVTVAVGYSGFLGADPGVRTVGASGGVFGILVAFAVLYGDRELMLFPFPFTIKAKYVVWGWIFITLISVFTPGPSGIAYFAHLGGALFGYLYLKFLPRRGLSYATSEKYFGIRNSYYRWKRRRAARKFEVYMRNHDRADYFDEHGNYRGPETKVPDKKNGESKSPWVN